MGEGEAVDRCQLCGQGYDTHLGGKTHHQFVGPGGSVKRAMTTTKKTEAKKGIPGDPVLRLALLRKGILTPEDLEKAEQDLRSGQPIVVNPPEPRLPFPDSST